MKWQKAPRPTEHWPHCFGTGSDEECGRPIDVKVDYEIGAVNGRMAYRCKRCYEALISRHTRNTEYATSDKQKPE